MSVNYLITGPPRSGKTTVIQNVVDRLDAKGYQAGGIYCPEIRSDGGRVGFEILHSANLAPSQESPPWNAPEYSLQTVKDCLNTSVICLQYRSPSSHGGGDYVHS